MGRLLWELNPNDGLKLHLELKRCFDKYRLSQLPLLGSIFTYNILLEIIHTSAIIIRRKAFAIEASIPIISKISSFSSCLKIFMEILSKSLTSFVKIVSGYISIIFVPNQYFYVEDGLVCEDYLLLQFFNVALNWIAHGYVSDVFLFSKKQKIYL